MGPLAGFVVDRVKRKSAILWGLEIWSVICASTALSRNFTQLLLFRAAEGRYDLVIVSLGLTNFDGLRLCSQLRSLDRTRNVPILAISEGDTEENTDAEIPEEPDGGHP